MRLELDAARSPLGGRISLGDIELDKQGDVIKAKPAPASFTTVFDVVLRDPILSFSRKDGGDTDHFEMRLTGDNGAELRFLPSAGDLKELAASGIPAPKPIRLKRAAR